MSDRNEPRTEAGRNLLDHIERLGYDAYDAGRAAAGSWEAAILAIEAEAAQGAAPRAEGRLLDEAADYIAAYCLPRPRRDDLIARLRAAPRAEGLPDDPVARAVMTSMDNPESAISRAIAIIEESRQTHVRWADWRRKGNGTDTDHEMLGDLEWHENAIRDYDHVLAVLRAAPLAPCNCACVECGGSDDTHCLQCASEGAAPRAEGLQPDTPASQFADRLAEALDKEWDAFLIEGEPSLNFGDYAERVAVRLSRPSDERVPESEAGE